MFFYIVAPTYERCGHQLCAECKTCEFQLSISPSGSNNT